MADDWLDLGDASLSELDTLDDRYSSKVQSENKAARGTGGFGTNKFDDAARDASRKQMAVKDEQFDRLADIHESRSDRAQALDESLDAERADSAEQWANNPDQYDWPGLDTPL